jgi:phosphate transport system substrate-binding protein
VPGIGSGLKLPRSAYPKIFLGQITRWNDPTLVAANPNLTLPDRSISLIVRQEGSGTTFTLTNHLSAVSTEWKDSVGAARAVRWPTRVDQARGNPGVAARLRRTEYSLGYVDLSDAWSAGLTVAAVENKRGRFVYPVPEAGTQAVADVKLPENLRAFVPDPDDAHAYPITSFTWVILPRRPENAGTGRAAREFFAWCLSNKAQDEAESLGYARLPPSVVEAARHKLAELDQ